MLPNFLKATIASARPRETSAPAKVKAETEKMYPKISSKYKELKTKPTFEPIKDISRATTIRTRFFLHNSMPDIPVIKIKVGKNIIKK